MAVSISDLREVTDNNDPGSANLSLRGGKAKVSYWWTSTNAADFHNMARLILGEAKVSAARGAAIARLMPIGHPRFPSLFAETITDFAGIGGQFVKEASFDPSDIADTTAGFTAQMVANFPQYARYPEYQISIEFANRLYLIAEDAVLGDPAATPWNDTKWDPTQNAGAGGFVEDPKKYWDTKEYYRWTWVTGGPKESWITVKSGQAGLNVGTGVTENKTLNDTVKVPMPDGAVLIKWFEVPYSFVRPSSGTSWFQLFQGRVNQTAFMNWDPGELLYVTISPKPYKSPIPTTDNALTTLCDLDIICLETKRLLAVGDDTTAPALLNWLKAGWNLYPFWLDKAMHYLHTHRGAGGTVLQPNQQPPTFRSFPMQILFSSPETALPP